MQQSFRENLISFCFDERNEKKKLQMEKKKKNLPDLVLSDLSGCSSVVGSVDMCGSSGDVGETVVSLLLSASWPAFLPIIPYLNHKQCSKQMPKEINLK